jgi:hypothetical protein
MLKRRVEAPGTALIRIAEHRLTLVPMQGRRAVKVPIALLDDDLADVQDPAAIKMDTRDAEPFIMAGGVNRLASTRMLAAAFCPYLMRQLGGGPEIVISSLEAFNATAIMRGGVTETPVFRSVAQAKGVLRQKLATAADTERTTLTFSQPGAP